MDYREFRERYEYDAGKDLLGQGGFGRVYRAYDRVMNCQVALKMFSREVPGHYDLLSEIRRAIDLNHPNVCRYRHAELIRGTDALGETQEIQVGIMEFIEGGTIDRYLRNFPQLRRNLITDVLRGLNYLHGRRPPIIHRDLKPSNVLVGFEDGIPVAKIADFGISKSLGTSGARMSGMVGTYEYMAPEQLSPERYGIDGKIHCNVDLWSFGVMLIELLTGELPFGDGTEMSTGQIMESIIRGIPQERLDSFEEPYRSVLKRCLVQNAAARAQSAEELLSLLGDGDSRTKRPLTDTPVVSRPPTGRTETIVDVRPPSVPRQKTRDEGMSRAGASGWPTDVESRPVIEPPKLLVDDPEQRLGRLHVGLLAAGLALLSVCGVGVAAWRHFGTRPQDQTPQTAVEGLAPPLAPAPVNGPSVSIRRSGTQGPTSSTRSSAKSTAPASSMPGPSSSVPARQTVVTQPIPDQSAPAEGGNSQTSPPAPTSAALLQQAEGLYNQQNYSAAGPLYERSCVAGSGAACRQVGEMYHLAQGFQQNDVEARRLFEIACDHGDGRGCNDLGALLLTGDGGPRDLPGAATNFTKACKAGWAEGCHNAQVALNWTQSPPAAIAQSMDQLVQACSAGNTQYCDMAGTAYRDGSGGVPRDYSRARAMFTASCNLHDGNGCTSLGAMYRDGLGVPKSDSLTVTYFSRGCDYGNAAGCSYLGNNYRYGLGLRENLSMARQLFGKGCQMGDQWGCQQLQQLR